MYREGYIAMSQYTPDIDIYIYIYIVYYFTSVTLQKESQAHKADYLYRKLYR